MRTMRTITMGLLLGASLFTACNKSENNMVDPANSSSAYSREGTSALYFKEAYVDAEEIVFMNNDEIVYKTRSDVPVNLAALLDKELDNRYYDNYTFRMTARPRGEMGTIMLKGAVQESDGRYTPVSFRYSEPVMITSAGRIVKTGPVSFLTLLNFDFNKLGRDIPPDLLMNAQRTDEGIMISNEINPHLYDMILEQLRNTVRMMDYAPPVPPSVARTFETDGGFRL